MPMKINKLKFMHNRHSKISVLLVLALLFFTIFGLYREYIKEDGWTDSGYENESLELRVRLSTLRTSLSMVEGKYESQLVARGYVSMTLLSLDSDFIGEMERIAAGRVPFVLAVSSDFIPGEDGCIGIEKFNSLLLKGWGASLYVKGGDSLSIESLSQELDLLITELNEREITVPSSLIIGRGYSKELDAAAAERGVSVICARDDLSYPLIESTEGEGGVWHPGVLGWNTIGKSKNTLNKLEKNGGYFMFTVDDYDGAAGADSVVAERFLINENGAARSDYERSLSSMLTYMTELAEDGNLRITTVEDALSSRLSYISSYEQMLPIMEAEKESIRVEMQALEEELYALIKEFGS